MNVTKADLGETEGSEKVERKGRVEQVIERVATGLGDGIGSLADSGVLWIFFAVVWVAFGAVLVVSQGSLDAAWEWVRDLPWLMQGVAWVLFLPVMGGLWIWETSWSLILRVAAIASLAAWTLLVFPSPWK